MTLPMKVLNRLRMGRDVAAAVAPKSPGHRAWVYVYPLLNPDEGRRVPSGDARIVRTGAGNPIRGFLVRYLEIDEAVAEEFHRGEREDLGKAAADEQLEVSNEEELVSTLRIWMSDLASLHVPWDVGYQFAEGPDLLSSPPGDLAR